ncbi:hypothetical protein Tco_0382336 [Tanacetum coccineum]
MNIVEANFYRVGLDASRGHPEHESKLSIKKEPVRRSPEAEAPGTTLRRSSQHLICKGLKEVIQMERDDGAKGWNARPDGGQKSLIGLLKY